MFVVAICVEEKWAVYSFGRLSRFDATLNVSIACSYRRCINP